MPWLYRHKWTILVLSSLIVVYIFSRLILLLDLPIFTDEAIYLRWAQIAKNDANWRFISLTDGKQPLFIWLMMLSMKLFSDPLFAGRIVSVCGGLATILGLFVLGREVFKNTTIGLISSFLYVVFPFSLVYDRMALYDTWVGTFAVFGLYVSILMVRSLQLDRALILGFIAGGAVLNKTSGFFIVYLLPFAFLLLDYTKKTLRSKLFRFALLSFIVVVLTYGFYSILRLSPFFYIINEKNAVFVYPLKEWLQHPFTFFPTNLSALFDWYMRYVGLPMTVLVATSFFIKKNDWREKVLLSLWFILPFLALALMGKTLYPRYILFMTLSLLPLAAYSLFYLSQRLSRKIGIGVVVLSLLYWVIADIQILSNFAGSPVPKSDKEQYLTAWPSGVGIDDATDFFRQQATEGPLYIATEGTFGLLPYAFELSFYDNPDVTIQGYWPIDSTLPDEIRQKALKMDTYVVFYQDCSECEGIGLAPKSWPLEKVLQVEKAQSGSYFTVYKVLP